VSAPAVGHPGSRQEGKQMGLVIVLVGMTVLGGLGGVAAWHAWGEPECAEEGRHPRTVAPAYCRLPRGHGGNHRYVTDREQFGL